MKLLLIMKKKKKQFHENFLVKKVSDLIICIFLSNRNAKREKVESFCGSSYFKITIVLKILYKHLYFMNILPFLPKFTISHSNSKILPAVYWHAG